MDEIRKYNLRECIALGFPTQQLEHLKLTVEILRVGTQMNGEGCNDYLVSLGISVLRW